MTYLALPFQYLGTLVDLDCILSISSEYVTAEDMDTFIKKLIALSLIPIIVLIWLKLTSGCCFKADKHNAQLSEQANY